MTQEEKLAKLREIIKDVDICMLTTIDAQGELHSRPMSNNREVEFNGDLWFFTYYSTPKVAEVQRLSKINASFADVKGQRYASVSGSAEIVRDGAKIAELWQPHLKAWFPEGKETPGITLLKVVAERAEYWDGSQSLVAHSISLLSSLVKGESSQVGENEKLDLK